MRTQLGLLRLAAALSFVTVGCRTEDALMALSGPDEGSSTSSSSTDGPGDLTLGTTTSTVTTSPPDMTSDASSSSTGVTSEEGSSTSIDPPAPPSILSVDVTPKPIEENGPITITVATADADGVRMELESGAVVDLDETADPGVFVGTVAALSGLDNGDHLVVVTPRLVDELGEPVNATYTLALPEPGTGLFWETGDLIGVGRVAAMGILPEGGIVELGMFFDKLNKPRCYIRRRTKDGAWGPQDLIALLPSSECEGIDLEIGDAGELFVLTRWKTNNNEFRWWLGEIKTWGAQPITRSDGGWGEEAYALAHRKGALAVCGSTPTSEGDLDASVRVFWPDESDALALFDYFSPSIKKPHWFDESARDCVFTADQIVVSVGEVHGQQEVYDKVERDRRYLLRYDFLSDVESVHVAEAGPGKATQSVARALDVDDQGRLYIVGRTCEDQCDAEGQLWVHDEAGTLLSQTSLGAFSNDVLAPRAVQWSPAGYAVVASGGTQGKDTDFTVRAYSTFIYDPVWSFTGPESKLLNVALTVSIGPYGEVCAGGFGSNGYPAVACIAG